MGRNYFERIPVSSAVVSECNPMIHAIVASAKSKDEVRRKVKQIVKPHVSDPADIACRIIEDLAVYEWRKAQ